MNNVAFKLVGNILLCVYNEGVPTPAEHEACVATFRKIDPARVRALIYTRGGTPTPAQRKDLNDVLNGRELMSAIVSDSTVVRGVVTALSWFNKRVKSFPTKAQEEAFRYLEIPFADWERHKQYVAELEADVASVKKKLG